MEFNKKDDTPESLDPIEQSRLAGLIAGIREQDVVSKEQVVSLESLVPGCVSEVASINSFTKKPSVYGYDIISKVAIGLESTYFPKEYLDYFVLARELAPELRNNARQLLLSFGTEFESDDMYRHLLHTPLLDEMKYGEEPPLKASEKPYHTFYFILSILEERLIDLIKSENDLDRVMARIKFLRETYQETRYSAHLPNILEAMNAWDSADVGISNKLSIEELITGIYNGTMRATVKDFILNLDRYISYGNSPDMSSKEIYLKFRQLNNIMEEKTDFGLIGLISFLLKAKV